MVSIKNSTIIFFCNCLIVCFLLVPFLAVAKDVTVTPAITVAGAYDDNDGSYRIRVGIDEIPAPIPEPTTLFLFGSGLIGLAGFGRKKFFKK